MTDDGAAFLSIAVVIASISGCVAVTAYSANMAPPKPLPSAEQICADRFWSSQYCFALLKEKTK